MSSNIQITRVCQFCNSEFTAKTTVTKYCSHRCASSSYKARTRNQNIVQSNALTVQTLSASVYWFAGEQSVGKNPDKANAVRR